VLAASPTGVSALSTAFKQWAQSMPAGAASVAIDPSGITVTSCDPGTSANLQPVATAQDALSLPLFRIGFVLGATGQGAPLAIARCAGTKMAETSTEAQLEDPNGALLTGPAGIARVQQAINQCRISTS
jgi:hypothetical protein